MMGRITEIPPAIARDARAELMWGKSPEEVLEFLRSKDIAEVVAAELIESVMVERAESIHAEGMKRVIYGVLFVVAPIAYYGISLLIGVLALKLFAALCVLGVVGIYKITVGASMVMKPRSHTGDLSNLND